MSKPNDIPLERVEESQIAPLLDAAIRELLRTCFPADAELFSRTRHWHGSAPAWSHVFAPGGDVQGHIGIVTRLIRVGRHEVTVAGVQNVAVHPDLRGSGLGPQMMAEAMEHARRAGLDFGLLFCVPALEKYYRSLGWITLDVPVVMSDAQGGRVPMPGKNICMFHPLNATAFPARTIDLQGADW